MGPLSLISSYCSSWITSNLIMLDMLLDTAGLILITAFSLRLLILLHWRHIDITTYKMFTVIERSTIPIKVQPSSFLKGFTFSFDEIIIINTMKYS